MTTTVLSGPAVEPVTLEEFKVHAKLPADLDEEDGAYRMYVAGARRLVERRSARALITRTLATTFEARMVAEMGCRLWLPFAPVASVEAVEWIGRDGEPTGGAVDYAARPGTPGLVRLSRVEACEGLRVAYAAGHGPTPDDVPEDARLAVCQLAAHWCERRLPVAPGSLMPVPWGVQALIDNLRWGSYPR